MSYNKLMVTAAPFFMVLLLTAFPAFAQESANCLACHSAMKGRVQTAGGALIDLNVDAERFQKSVHGSLACTDCHMKFVDNPHSSPDGTVPQPILDLAGKISGKFSVDPVAAAACSLCHSDTYQKVLDSVHGKNIVEKHQKDGALCLDCHGSPHYIVPVKDAASPVGRKHQVDTCGKCHGNEELIKKYGLQENVMESFKESFHGRKLHLGHTKVPVCASCHGAHDIKKHTDPTSPVFGDNRLKTCGQCHKGANRKFIPAITHAHPGPIPHYTEKALILLVIGVFTFIISHVLLEAFADIRDSVFKKGGHE